MPWVQVSAVPRIARLRTAGRSGSEARLAGERRAAAPVTALVGTSVRPRPHDVEQRAAIGQPAR